MTEAERTVILPPVMLDSYEEFRTLARDAAVLTYHPEYVSSPFLDDPKRLKRVILHAVGVIMNGLPMTFKYVLDYYDIPQDGRDIEEILSDIISSLQSNAIPIRGILDSGGSPWDPLAIRP